MYLMFFNMIIFCLLLFSCQSKTSSSEINAISAQSNSKMISDIDGNISAMANECADSLPTEVLRLIEAYPETDISYSANCLVVNGERIVYDDGNKKSFVELLDNSDVEDMFVMKYDTTSAIPAFLSDAGRGRCEALFKAMYGHNAKEVSKNLVTVDWFGQKLRFTKVNSANKQLERVAQELRAIPHLAKYFKQSSTFYWRKVRGSNRQSAHSYGMAIDINVANSDYWLWANPHKSETDKIKYKNRIPIEIVQVFEKHGFIWGGRWYHFDTMHFEYRPELL